MIGLEQGVGVNVVGYVHEQSGLGEIARMLVRVLDAGRIPHVVIPYGRRSLRERLRPVDAPFPTTILCVNADVLPRLVEEFGSSFLLDRRTIGFWWWEVERLPSIMAWASHLVDEIWVGSEHVRRAVAAAVDKPVWKFPIPIVLHPPAPIARAKFGVPEDRYAVLFSFSYTSVFERKNPLDLVDAFARAFAPDDGPVLVLKTTNGERYPRERDRLREAAGRHPHVLLLERELSPERYHALVAACDAYASLHRAEGYGLTIAEAMALGKPALATGYSGNLEFMTDENSLLIPYELVPIPQGTRPYPPASWADPDVCEAARALRALVDRPDEAAARAACALRDIRAGHDEQRTVSWVVERLAEPPPPRRTPTDPIERAAYQLMWGPDLEGARPWARRLRRVVRPFLRPYLDHQREVSSLVLEAQRSAIGRDEIQPRTRPGDPHL